MGGRSIFNAGLTQTIWNTKSIDVFHLVPEVETRRLFYLLGGPSREELSDQSTPSPSGRGKGRLWLLPAWTHLLVQQLHPLIGTVIGDNLAELRCQLPAFSVVPTKRAHVLL